MKILFVTSEAYPLIKTGGLADVSGSLPVALRNKRQDVRLLLPAYHEALEQAGDLRTVATLEPPGASQPIRILEGTLPGTRVKVWLVDYPPAFNRPGNPYMTLQGDPWPDNAQRFALLSRVTVEIAQNRAGLDWRPDVVHCHDWQTALVPALLSLEAARPATVFTIHNLSYQGIYDPDTFIRLDLAPALWQPDGLEYYGKLNIIKGGLVYADIITTVSPTYAEEIQTYEFGYGLEGLLHHRRDRLHGILNGVDYDKWNPAQDPRLKKPYTARTLDDKDENKKQLRRDFGLSQKKGLAVIGMITRLVEQKGIDLVLDAMPRLIQLPLQFVILGGGDSRYEWALGEWAKLYPDRIGLHIGYDETIAHRIEAGADIFLMPSRFEPCGLNQMYSQRYGTIPIVRRVGGLADSVIDATDENIAQGTATGIIFDHADANAVCWAVERSLTLYQDLKVWRGMMRAGMRQSFDWKTSAGKYIEVYEEAVRLAALRP